MNTMLLRLLPLLLSVGLCGCDSAKQKLIGLLDDAIGDSTEESTSTYKGASIRQITEVDYDEFVSISGHVVIVDFYANWCPPCRRLSPVLNDLVAKHGGKVLLGKVNVDKNKKLASKLKVSNIPDVRIFVDDKQVDRFVGMPPVAAVQKRVERQLKKLKPSDPPTAEPSPMLTVDKPLKKPKPEKSPAENPTSSGKPAAGKEPEGTQPAVQPMDKDWLPPGMQRR